MDPLQSPSWEKWFAVFIFEIVCNIVGFTIAIVFKISENKKTSRKTTDGLLFLVILLLIDSFADIYSYNNIRDRYQSTLFLSRDSKFINLKHFNLTCQKKCFQNISEIKSLGFLLSNENQVVKDLENSFPKCFDEPKNIIEFLKEKTPKNSTFYQEIIKNEKSFLEEQNKKFNKNTITYYMGISFFGFSCGVSLKDFQEIRKTDPKFEYSKCSTTQNMNEISSYFQNQNFFYFLLYANSIVDIFVLVFLPFKEKMLNIKKNEKENNNFSSQIKIYLVFLTFFPRVTSCFLMGIELVQFSGCIVIHPYFKLYSIVFWIYIVLALYFSFILLLYFVVFLYENFCNKKKFLKRNCIMDYLIFLSCLPSLFLNYIPIKIKPINSMSKDLQLLFTFFFPFYLSGFLATVFLWVVWLNGSTENIATAILQMSTFSWALFDFFFSDLKEKLKEKLISYVKKKSKKTQVEAISEGKAAYEKKETEDSPMKKEISPVEIKLEIADNGNNSPKKTEDLVKYQYFSIQTIKDALSKMLSVGLSQNDDFLIFGGENGKLNVKKFSDKEFIDCQTLVSYSFQVLSVTFCNQFPLVAFSGSLNQVQIFEISNGEFSPLQILSDHNNSVQCVTFSDEFPLFASGSFQTVNIYKVTNEGLSKIQVMKDHLSSVFTVAFRNNFFASGGDDRKICLYKITNNSSNFQFTLLDSYKINKKGHQVHSLAFCYRFPLLAVSGIDSIVNVFHVTSSRLTGFKSLSDHIKSVRCITFCKPYPFFASGGDDFTINIYQISTQAFTKIQTLSYHDDSIYSLSFGNNYLASASSDKTVQVFKIGIETSLVNILMS